MPGDKSAVIMTLVPNFAYYCAFSITSRELGVSPSDDFSVSYFPTYQAISSGLSPFEFGFGVEVGLPLMFWFMSTLLPPLSIRELLFIVSFVQYLIVGAAGIAMAGRIASGATSQPDALRRVALIAFLASFPSVASSVIVRQFIAVFLAVLALCIGHPIWRRFLGFTAVAFHTSTILIFVVAGLGKRGAARTRTLWLLFIVALFLGVLTLSFGEAVLSFPGAALVLSKLVYYLTGQAGFINTDLRFLGNMILLLVASIAGRVTLFGGALGWKELVFMLVVYVVLLPFPLAAYRTFFVIHTAVFFPLLFGFLFGRKPILGIAIAFAYLAYRVLSVNTGSGTDGMEFWYAYKPVS